MALVATGGVYLLVNSSPDSPKASPRPRTTSGTRARPGASDPTTTSTPGSTPSTEASSPGPYAVASDQVTVAATNNEGVAVSVPTQVFYPQLGSPRPLPLVVFSPGYMIAPGVYDGLIGAWVGAGMVVAEPTYPDTAPGAPPDEYDMVNHPRELRQVIAAVEAESQSPAAAFHGLVDSEEVAVAGHSDGGDVALAAAANTCCQQPGLKAALILSGAEETLFGGQYFVGSTPPVMVVQGGQDPINVPACSEQIYDEAPQPRYYLDIPSADHLSAYTTPGAAFAVVEQVTTEFLLGYVASEPAELAKMAAQVSSSGVASLYEGPTTVAVQGSCLGAPAGS